MKNEFDHSGFEVQKARRGEVLQRKGEVGTKVYFVQKGLLRSYSIDKKGNEHIFLFGPEGWIIADSCLPAEPCMLYIDALEDSEYVVRDKNYDQAAIKASFEAMTRRIFQLQKRVLMQMGSSALERYEYFEQTYPDLVQRVPQRMIASYLGITPVGLSKAKSQRLKNKQGGGEKS